MALIRMSKGGKTLTIDPDSQGKIVIAEGSKVATLPRPSSAEEAERMIGEQIRLRMVSGYQVFSAPEGFSSDLLIWRVTPAAEAASPIREAMAETGGVVRILPGQTLATFAAEAASAVLGYLVQRAVATSEDPVTQRLLSLPELRLKLANAKESWPAPLLRWAQERGVVPAPMVISAPTSAFAF